MTTLYPPSRSSACIFTFNHCLCILLQKKKKKKTPWFTMGKNIKSYATTQVNFPWKREGYLTAKSPNLLAKIWYGLTVHIHSLFLNLQAKFFKFTLCLLAKFPVNYTNSVQFAPKIPRIMLNLHHLFIQYTLCFQMPDHRQRTL